MSQIEYNRIPSSDLLALTAVWECKKEAAKAGVALINRSDVGLVTIITYLDDGGHRCPYGFFVPGNPYGLNEGQERFYDMGSGGGAPPRAAGAGAGGDTIMAYDATFNGEPIISVTDAIPMSANDFLNTIVLSLDSTASFRRLIA